MGGGTSYMYPSTAGSISASEQEGGLNRRSATDTGRKDSLSNKKASGVTVNSSFASNPSSPMPPQNQLSQEEPTSRRSHLEADSAIGQFSFAPATQTTVVTTTTTTTTRFPPFVMRAPRRMQDLDPKLYPLATTPTPSSLKNISFDLNGKATLFREAEDVTAAVEDFEQEKKMLKSNGAMRTVQTFGDGSQDRSNPAALHSLRSTPKRRPVSPDSITDHPRTVRETRSTTSSRPRGSQKRGPAFLNLFNTRRADGPATPDKDSRERHGRRRPPPTSLMPEGVSMVDRTPLSPSRLNKNTPRNLAAAPDAVRPQSSHGFQSTRASCRSPNMENTCHYSASNLPDSQSFGEGVVPTPPIQGDERQFAIPPARRNVSFGPSRLTAVDTSIAQDGSLPSPSLSPVTAAANLHNTGYFADTDSNSELASQQDHEMGEGSQAFDKGGQRSFECRAGAVTQQSANGRDPGPELLQSSVKDIPAMLDFFEAIPDELKSYVMHQLLRRCPKPTLHLVADVVNPALKCDFVGVLPPELSLNILRFLDAKSLCRASQVSQKWRHMVNGDEQAWKDLLDADGLSLPREELQRAILEGWGWQDPVGVDGWEQDIGTSSWTPRSESDASISRSVANHHVSPRHGQANARRAKRKAPLKLSTRKKQLKRRDASAEISDKLESIDLMSQMSSAEGPYNAANAAAMAVPYPQIGLASLKDLHLYKSLYRRHHLIRKNWMREDAKPRHTAFRAHDRHVVTCLGFDDDKIITGSDDTNINIYDTKTGALRAKLKGHEGGVWALQYEGNVLVSGSTDRSVRVWDIENGEQMQVFQGHTSTVRCLQILSPTKMGETADGKAIMVPKQPLIITGSRDSSLRVWKLPQPDDPRHVQVGPSRDDTDCPYFVRVLTGHQHSVRAIAAHADTLVSGSYDCTVRVWKISTGETVHRLQGHTQKVYSVVLDHARNRCISGSMDYLVKIWSLDTGSILHTLEGHSLLVGLLDLNSERLVSAAADSTLRIWDPENGQCKATLTAHTGAITCFQHDGQKVISGSDRTLKMWNVKTGECARDLLTGLSGVWQVKFNERRCVAAVQRDHMTYIEVLDFGAIRDGIPESKRGHRIVVDVNGVEVEPDAPTAMEIDGAADEQ